MQETTNASHSEIDPHEPSEAMQLKVVDPSPREEPATPAPKRKGFRVLRFLVLAFGGLTVLSILAIVLIAVSGAVGLLAGGLGTGYFLSASAPEPVEEMGRPIDENPVEDPAEVAPDLTEWPVIPADPIPLTPDSVQQPEPTPVTEVPPQVTPKVEIPDPPKPEPIPVHTAPVPTPKPEPKTTPKADTPPGVQVTLTGGVPVRLGTHRLPGPVPPGHHEIFAEFQPGSWVSVGTVQIQSKSNTTIHCNKRMANCRIGRN